MSNTGGTSPPTNNELEPAVPWTIDNSESRISQLVENSPKRSILKEVKTPNPYLSPQFSRSKIERHQQLINRRVSFASDAKVREYNKHETPNSPSVRTSNQKLPIPSPEDGNTRYKLNSTIFDSEPSSPSARRNENAYLSRLSGSPMDRRKRRRDMFGSPPGQRESKRTPVVYPEFRVRGMRSLGDEDDDDDDDSPHSNYFMQFLSQESQSGSKRLFDDDDDSENTDNNRDKAVSSQADPSSSTIAQSPFVDSHRNEPATQNVHESVKWPRSTQFSSLSNSQENTSGTSPQRLPFFTSAKPTAPISSLAILAAAAAERTSISNMDETGTMPLTLQQEGMTNTIGEPATPTQDTMDLWTATMTTAPRGLLDQSQSRRTTLDFQQQMDVTPASTQLTSTTANRQSASRISSLRETLQSSSERDSERELQTSMSSVSMYQQKRHTKSPVSGDHYATISTSSPARTLLRSPFTPSAVESVNGELLARSPRVGMSVLDNIEASPILPLQRQQSPSSANLFSDHNEFSRHLRRQNQAEPFSPQRSFYLHDEAQLHSPLVTRANTHQTSHRAAPSPLHQLNEATQERSEHSIGSDYAERMMLGDENVDLFEEELPQLYESFVEDKPRYIPLTLSQFFARIGYDFNENMSIIAPKKQLTFDSNNNGPVQVDEQATTAACILPELEAYKNLAGTLEDKVNILRAQLQQLDEDLSENNPQIFEEYADASAELCLQLDERFELVKKLALAEAESEWYNILIATLEDLKKQFESNIDLQRKDRQLMQQMNDHITANLPQLLAHQYNLTKAIKEAREKEKSYQQTDYELVKRYERDIKDQAVALEKSQKEFTDWDQRERDTRQKLSLLEERKKELLIAIRNAEATKEAHPYVSERDLLDAKDHYHECASICAWKLENKSDDTMQFTIFNDLDVLINTSKLKNHQVDAVFIRMLETRDKEYGPFAELVHGLQIMAKNSWQQEKIMQDIAIYWNRLRMIRKEVTKMKHRFWIEIESLTQDPFADADIRGLRCQITVYSYIRKLKFLLTLEIRPKQVMAYPHSIDLSTLRIAYCYGSISFEALEKLVRKKLKQRGIIGLETTLRSIIEEV